MPLPTDKGKDMELQDTADSMERALSGPLQETDFHGATVIDSNGREVPITEAMVQEALTRLSRTGSGLELQWL